MSKDISVDNEEKDKDSLNEKIAKSAKELSKFEKISAYAEERKLNPTPCYFCGKPATKYCQKCMVAKYCTRECQISHHKKHKIACKVDSEALNDSNLHIFSDKNARRVPKLEKEIFHVNSNCCHGGPSPSKCTLVLSKLTQLLQKISSGPGSDPQSNSEMKSCAELHYCEIFIRENLIIVLNPDTIAILIGMAVDAFAANDEGYSRMYCRIVFFFEAYIEENERFISSLHDVTASVPSPTSALYRMGMKLQFTSSRSGLISELQNRTKGKCVCMVVSKGHG